MSGFTNQQHIRNFRYETVALAESSSTNARDTDVCFVFETKQHYSYIDGDTTAIDSVKVLDANGGNGRWISIGSIIEADNGLTRNGDIIELGGTLNRDTLIDADGNRLAIGGAAGSMLVIGSHWFPLDLFYGNANEVEFIGNDFIRLDSPMNMAALVNHPDGTVDLAIATTKYVNDSVSAVAHWKKVSNILLPTDPAVTGWTVENNHNGYTQCLLKNTDDAGNGAGAVMELKGSGADYTNNVYFGIYGASFWIPLLAGAAALMTDKNINIGTVGTGMDMRFIAEGGYGSPNQMADGNIKGFHYTTDLSGDNTADPRWIPDKGYVDTQIANATPTKETDRFTLTGTDITNNYIDLTQTPDNAQHIFVFYEGQYWDEGEDYNIAGNRITFVSTITATDKVVIKYFS